MKVKSTFTQGDIVITTYIFITHLFLASTGQRTYDYDESTTEDFFPSTGEPIDEETEPFPHVPIINSTRCGESLRFPNFGIFYKPFESLVSNERCIWTIFVEDATGFEVNVSYFGFEPNSENGLVISEFGKARKPTHFMPTDTNMTILRNTSLIMITFYVGPNGDQQSGFVLQYKAHYDGSRDKPLGQHFIIGSNQYFHDYPNGVPLNRNELSSFVFSPNDNIYHEGRQNVVIIMFDEPTYCEYGIFLKVYIFNSTRVGREKWEFQGRICGSEIAEEQIRSSEPILIIFESEHNFSVKGFKCFYAVGL